MKEQGVILQWRTCPVDRVRFIPLHGRQIYCCKECARIAKNEKQREHANPDLYKQKKIDAAPRVPEGINQILRECARLGLSYGKYVQRLRQES